MKSQEWIVRCLIAVCGILIGIIASQFTIMARIPIMDNEILHIKEFDSRMEQRQNSVDLRLVAVADLIKSQNEIISKLIEKLDKKN